MSDQKFKGADFVANFSIIKDKEFLKKTKQAKRERFQKTVEMALDRVKNDLVNTMTLKDPDTFVREISDEEIDKFTQYGIKITIIGEVKE